MASHRAGPTGAGTFAAPAQGSAMPFPSRGSPTLPPFRNPIFYLSCLSGLGQSGGDSSPSARPRGRPQAADKADPRFLFPRQHASCPGSAPARTSSHRERRRGKKRCGSARFPVQAGLLRGVQASESFFLGLSGTKFLPGRKAVL